MPSSSTQLTPAQEAERLRAIVREGRAAAVAAINAMTQGDLGALTTAVDDLEEWIASTRTEFGPARRGAGPLFIEDIADDRRARPNPRAAAR